MVKEVVSFSLDPAELQLLDTLAQKYRVSRSKILSEILMIFAKNLAMQEILDEKLKDIAQRKIEQQALKEVRNEGKALLQKATFSVRMRKFYTKLIEDGVTWDKLKPTFISWFKEAKILGIDEKEVMETIEEIALIYYRTRQDIDMEKGLEDVYQLFLQEEVEGLKELDSTVKKEGAV